MEEQNGTQINGHSMERIQHLHDLLDDAKELEDKIEQQSVEKSLSSINEIISTANQLMNETAADPFPSTNEAVLDSILLRQSHELVSKVFQKTNSFDVTELAKAIRKIVYKDDEYNWNNFAPYIFKLSNTVYTNVPMSGYIDVKPKVREQRERQQRRRAELGEIQRPLSTSQLELKEKGGEGVKHVHKQINQIFRANGRKPIPYYRLIIDPNDFNNTVQNAFQISFLVRENILGIDNGPDGRPQVRLISSAELKASSSTGDTGAQAICNLSFAVCERMCNLYNIKEPMIVWVNVKENDDEDSD